MFLHFIFVDELRLLQAQVYIEDAALVITTHFNHFTYIGTWFSMFWITLCVYSHAFFIVPWTNENHCTVFNTWTLVQASLILRCKEDSTTICVSERSNKSSQSNDQANIFISGSSIVVNMNEIYFLSFTEKYN